MKLGKTAAGSKKVTISKTEWTTIGKQAGWIKCADIDFEKKLRNLGRAVRSVCDPCASRMRTSTRGDLRVRHANGEIKTSVPPVHVVIPRGT